MANEKVLGLHMNLSKMKNHVKFLRATINRISEMASASHSTQKRAKLNTTVNGNSTLNTA